MTADIRAATAKDIAGFDPARVGRELEHAVADSNLASGWIAFLRGKGVGDALLRLAEAEFVRRGCTNVALQLGKGNDGARVFYRAHGYGERAGFELHDKTLGKTPWPT